MGDEDHSRVERLELPFEPFEALDVEVVRRLVEQEQVRIDGKRARQRGARELSPREGCELPLEVLVAKPEPTRSLGDSVAPVPAAGVLESCLRLGVPAHGRFVVCARGHIVLEAPQLVLDGEQVASAREDVLPEREVGSRGGLWS